MKKNHLPTANPRTIEDHIGYHFQDRALYALALTHPSYRHETAGDAGDNQRLEFLGDAALGLAVAAALYEGQPEAPEGTLTALRSRLTNRHTLAAIGRELGIGSVLRLGHGETQSGGATRASNLADAVEALLGAVYLDGGMTAVDAVFRRVWQQRLGETVQAEEDNPKGTLQIYVQKRWKESPTYRVLTETGPAHAPHYTCEVVVHDVVRAQGEGPSKRAAEADAARHALAALDVAPSTVTSSPSNSRN